MLIKNARIVDPNSPLNGKKRDILIKKGKIAAIKSKIDAGKARVIDLRGASLSPGWMDVGTQVGDPGFEHREDLASAMRAAAAGGYTAIACLPNTLPAIHSKSEVNYIRKNTADDVVDFHPIGAISRDCAGKDLAELFDMHTEGAVAFSDGLQTIQSSGLMMRALQYVKAFDGLVINHPHDASIDDHGQIHEGEVSVSLGMKGIPSMAEELMVQRDIYLLDYTASRLHLSNISSARSVSLLKEAKANKLAVTASVPVLNLVYDEQAVSTFDSHFKVLPPLRARTDRRALRRALKSGLIELISSNHVPHDIEGKNLEFPYAEFGAIGLETTFALCMTHLVAEGEFELDELIHILAYHPRQVLGLSLPSWEEGAPANFTIFNPEEEWIYTSDMIQSKSANSPIVGAKLRGKVLGIINNGQHHSTAV